MENQHNIEERNDVYQAKIISRDFEKGKDYTEARRVISIFILNYKMFEYDEYIQKTIKVLEGHKEHEVKSITTEYYIELPKFRKMNADMNIKLNQWLALLDDEDRGRIKMAEKKNKVIKDAMEELDYLLGNKELREAIDKRDLWESDLTNMKSYAEEKGEARGIAKGEKIGEVRGITKGKEEEKREIAKKLKEKGIDIDFIAETTGLTKEEIEKL